MKTKLRVIFSIVLLFAMSNALSLDTLRVGVSLGSGFHQTRSKDISTRWVEKFSKKERYAGVFVGYDHLIAENPIFLGLEGEFANHNAEKTTPIHYITRGSLKVATNNSAIVSARLGVSTKNILIYGKAGIASTNWRVTLQSRIHNHQKKYQKFGSVFGFGIECAMNNNFSIGIEQTYIKCNSLERIHPDLNLKVVPEIHATVGRLMYRF